MGIWGGPAYPGAKRPPIPAPELNFGSFSNGRGVYEVEEEMLRLDRVLARRFWLWQIFSIEWWEIRALSLHYSISLRQIKRDRFEYETQFDDPARVSAKAIRRGIRL